MKTRTRGIVPGEFERPYPRAAARESLAAPVPDLPLIGMCSYCPGSWQSLDVPLTRQLAYQSGVNARGVELYRCADCREAAERSYGAGSHGGVAGVAPGREVAARAMIGPIIPERKPAARETGARARATRKAGA